MTEVGTELPHRPASAGFAVGYPRRRSRAGVASAAESASVWLLAFAAYLLLGFWVTVHLHVAPGDGISRLTHAYYVFWNVPAKLAAIGFVWPPLITVVFLPLVAIKPLATGLWALPIMSAFFGAGLLATLQAALRRSGMTAVERTVLVLLFAANPLVAFYSSNGMSEVVGWWFLTLAVASFVRWYVEAMPRRLIATGIFLALAALTRYELVLWAAVVVVAIGATVWRRSRDLPEFEASAVAVIAPVAYALGAWSFLNWQIVGSAFAWLHSERTQTFETYAASTHPFGHVTLAKAANVVFPENAKLFPLVLAAAVSAVVAGIVWRSVMGIALAAMLLLNAFVTIVLATATDAPHLFELRLNVRPMPLVLLTVGWLYATSRSALVRRGIWLAAAVGLAISIPLTWHTMRTFAFRLDEPQFARALVTGRDQAHRMTGIDPVEDQRMARYVDAHVQGENAILTDDVQTFGVVLATGRPGMFLDRIDLGDAFWLEIAHAPYGHVQYLLLSWLGADRLRQLYPRIYDHGGRGVRLVYATRTAKLYRIVGPLR